MEQEKITKQDWIDLIEWLLTRVFYINLVRRNKTREQQEKFYRVDNIYQFMVDTYENGDTRELNELYRELSQTAQNSFLIYCYCKPKSESEKLMRVRAAMTVLKHIHNVKF